MSNSTYFIQGCPTCGRRSQIRVKYLGKNVVCQHCGGHFLAADPANVRCDTVDDEETALHRADELLETMAQRKTHARFPNPR